VPSTYTLDADACLGLVPQRCDECLKACEQDAIDIDMQPEIVEEDVGAIILATGYDLYPIEKMAEYGYGKHEDVIDGLQLEQLINPSGPIGGGVRRPSDGKVPKHVVFVQCVGSRDPELHKSYCSKICCMYMTKLATLYKKIVPDGHAYVLYIDIRAAGKDYEEFVQRAMEESHVLYIRGKVSKIFREKDKLMVWGADTLTGKKIEIAADMVVLAMAIVPSEGTAELAKSLRISTGPDGFLKEVHPKLRPVETLTAGMYIAGASQAPKDIPETVAHAGGAASKAIGLVSAPELEHAPTVVNIDELICSGCGICIPQCPYNALKLNGKDVAEVNEVICEGCGVCSAACPSGAIQLKNLTDEQIFKMVEGGLSTTTKGGIEYARKI